MPKCSFKGAMQRYTVMLFITTEFGLLILKILQVSIHNFELISIFQYL